MRIAWKYVPESTGRRGLDRTAGDFADSMATAEPQTREDVASRVSEGQRGEVLDLLAGLLDPGRSVLSVGCGDGCYEAVLAASGYQVTASDIAPELAAATVALFPELRFFRVDALAPVLDERFDDLLAIGLDYALDDGELERLFVSARSLLLPGGRMIVAHVYRATPWTWLLDRVLLPLWARPRLQGRRPEEQPIMRKQHGYRRSDREFLRAAAAAGFGVGRKVLYSHGVEFSRIGINLRWPSLYEQLRALGLQLGLFAYGTMFELHLLSRDA